MIITNQCAFFRLHRFHICLRKRLCVHVCKLYVCSKIHFHQYSHTYSVRYILISKGSHIILDEITNTLRVSLAYARVWCMLRHDACVTARCGLLCNDTVSEPYSGTLSSSPQEPRTNRIITKNANKLYNFNNFNNLKCIINIHHYDK